MMQREAREIMGKGRCKTVECTRSRADGTMHMPGSVTSGYQRSGGWPRGIDLDVGGWVLCNSCSIQLTSAPMRSTSDAALST
jgi:hypothetical protein